jgi:hypothetical protein
MTTRGATLAALLAALGRPSWWILALAGFLVRGGILLFVIAIVTLPSPLALSNVLGPILTPLYLGRLERTTVILIGVGIVGVVAWIVAGGWFAAATEVVLVREAARAATEEGLADRPDRDAGRLLIGRSAAAHLIALIPMALTLGFGSVQIFGVAYRELVNPSDAGPIVLREIGGASGPVAAILVTWILGEVVGGMAVRRIVLGGEPVVGAVVSSGVDLVRRPAGGLLAPLATTAVLVVDLGAVLAVVMIVWTEVRTRLLHPLDEPFATALVVVTFGAAWCLALLVTGLIDAWRSAAMTFELGRATSTATARSTAGDDGRSQPGPSGGGTIGVPGHGRPGDWSADDPGGSL